jgi:hypothetical protein
LPSENVSYQRPRLGLGHRDDKDFAGHRVLERLVDPEVVVLAAQHGADRAGGAAARDDLDEVGSLAVAAAGLVDRGDAVLRKHGGGHSSSRSSAVRRWKTSTWTVGRRAPA